MRVPGGQLRQHERVQKRLSELALDPSDLRADARLGDVHASRGAREASLLGHGHEVLER